MTLLRLAKLNNSRGNRRLIATAKNKSLEKMQHFENRGDSKAVSLKKWTGSNGV